ncbi:hypothetical protein [Persicobacter sp. CCB-QB2]|uniref:hypothetical protein n=1 Tax=Persicobacter sp. CCB-QB2 TaxID=1561025 RepID=UPI0006A9617B|nr:hypothetical protein [Persicobacter sp. CCB-QB2]
MLNVRYSNIVATAEIDAQKLENQLQKQPSSKTEMLFVAPFWAKKALRDAVDKEKVGVILDFPYGNSRSESILTGAQIALKEGAKHVAITYPYGAHASGMNWPKILFAQLSKLVHSNESLLWVYLDTAHLPEPLLAQALNWIKNAGVDGIILSQDQGNHPVNQQTIDFTLQTLAPQLWVHLFQK